MEVGTAEIIDDIAEVKKRRSGLLGGSSSGSGGGNNGGGSDGPNDDAADQVNRFDSQKSRILTFFLLLAILMTFGGLIAAYVVIATNNVAEWKPLKNLPVQVWVSTIIILASSVTYHFAQTAIGRNNQQAAKNWLIATTVLGAAFISSQIMAWIALTNRGFYMSGNPYAGFFYVLTAVHAVHVLGGITALGSVLLRSWMPTRNADAITKRTALAQVVGWYWHFMGGLWLVLFILLGFWK